MQGWIDQIRARGYVAVDTETTSLDEMRAELVGISLCVEPGVACYIPLAHRSGGDDLFGSASLIEGQIRMLAERQSVPLGLKPNQESASPGNW